MFQTIALVLVVAAPGSKEKNIENPLKAAKIGDWVEYKLTATGGGAGLAPPKENLKRTITARTDKTVTIKNEGGGGPGEDVTFDIDAEFDIRNVFGKKEVGDLTIVNGKATNDKITVAGKEYECNRQPLTMTQNAGGQNVSFELVVWIAKKGPLDGVVKMEMKMSVAGMNVEALVEMVKFGSK